MSAGNQSIREWNCPRDGARMASSTDLSLRVNVCRDCSGLWVPKAQIVGRVDGAVIRKLYHAPSTRLTEIRCPADGSPMWEFSAGGILVDRCNQCGGLWFDAGELAAVMSKVRFTTSPTGAMAGGKMKADEENSLWDLLMPPPSGAEVALELVFEIVKWVASAVAD
jgi:Zn-finger nucleic acid-binding protein